MTETELKVIEERAAKATGVPELEHDFARIDVLVDEFEQGGRWKNHTKMMRVLEALQFAAHARQDVPALLAEVRELSALKVDGAICQKISELTNENARLREALKDIAGQKLSTEMSEEECERADFDGGYGGCVTRARAALEGK